MYLGDLLNHNVGEDELNYPPIHERNEKETNNIFMYHNYDDVATKSESSSSPMGDDNGIASTKTTLEVQVLVGLISWSMMYYPNA